MNNPNSPLKKSLDAAAIAAFAAVCASGVVLRNSLPPHARDIGLLANPVMPGTFGLTNGEWASLNDAATLLLLVLLLPNLFWGWGAIAKILKKGDGSGSATRAAIGVVSALTLLASLFTGFNVSGPAGIVDAAADSVSLLGDRSGAELLALTLPDIEKRMGVPREFVRVNLGLPYDVSDNEPISALMKAYGFSLENVRTVILAFRAGGSLKIPEPPQN